MHAVALDASIAWSRQCLLYRGARIGRLQREEARLFATTTSPDRHRIDEMAIALRQAAHEADVEIARSYARRVAATSKGTGKLGVSRLGSGVVIHTVPATKRSLPVIVGYADNRGQWYQDGSRHVEVHETDEPIEDIEEGS
jgi:hypothetical protein